MGAAQSDGSKMMECCSGDRDDSNYKHGGRAKSGCTDLRFCQTKMVSTKFLLTVPITLMPLFELLKARVATGAATFLIKKVKAHRGEPSGHACRGSARSRQGKRAWSPAPERIGWCTNGKKRKAQEDQSGQRE